MVPTALALVIAAPMQLAAAAGLEFTGGYDSTVINQLSLQFGDGGIMRSAIDLQVGHHTETLRQVLRLRGELYFAGGEGRSFDKSDLTSLNRYTLQWEPDDLWRLNFDAGYNVGQGALLFQRTGDVSLAFLRGVYGEYSSHATLTRTLSDNARIVPSLGLVGRHTIEIPEGAPRADSIQLTGGVMGSIDVGERDTFGLTGNTQAMQITGLGDWLMRVTTFLSWRHAWSDYANTTISAGVDMLQDQTDATRSRWNVGPYGSVTYMHAFPDANLALVARAHYEFTSVNAVRCNNLSADGTCPPDQVIAGGAGRVGGAGLQLLWRPFDQNIVFTGEALGDYGVTENFVPGSGLPGSPSTTQSVGNANFTAGAGARWIITRGVSVFTRYNFLYQHVDEPAWYPDIVRHVALAGVIFSMFAGDAEQLLGVTPLEEAIAADAIRAAAGPSQSSGGGGGGGNEGNGEGVLDDPLVNDDAGGNDNGNGGGDNGGGWFDDANGEGSTSRDPAWSNDPALRGRPRQPRQPEAEPAPTGRPLQPGQQPPRPEHPAQPEEPEQPAQPTQPTQPAPAQPAQPAQPTTPAAPTPGAPGASDGHGAPPTNTP